MTNRRNAVITGILFIAATGATVASQMLSSPLLANEHLVSGIADNAMQFRTSMLFELLNAFASTGIAISMYVVLRSKNRILGVGYLGLRIIEGTLGSIAVASHASLLSLCESLSAEGAILTTQTQVLLSQIQSNHDFMFLLVLIAFNLSAFILYPLLYRSRLVPRFLSVWGFIGAVTLAIANVSQFYGLQLNGLAETILSAPIGLNEIALAFWLVIKGFNTDSQLPDVWIPGDITP